MDKYAFKFKLDEMVITPFGKKGLIDMLGFDDGGRQNHVKTAESSNWFKKDQLTSCDAH